MNGKKFSILVICGLLIVLLIMGALNVIVDPYFHYHAPLKNLSYELDADKERYISCGILDSFEYDAVIIGTSMTQNFKASEFDALFGVDSIKATFSGAMNKELNDRLKSGLENHPDTKIVVRSLDWMNLLADKDAASYDDYPEYLYDEKLINDVNYVFNKTVLIDGTFNTLRYTRKGNETTDFDAYANWMEGKIFGKEAVLSNYERPTESDGQDKVFDSEYRARQKANIEQNIIETVKKYPDTQFYLFIPPYSIVWFDGINQNGELQCYLDAMKAEIELLLPYENVHLFAFFDEYDMICDLDNYKDTEHYGDWINSQILQWMKDGTHELTAENYESYCAETEAFYSSYDYDALFKG